MAHTIHTAVSKYSEDYGILGRAVAATSGAMASSFADPSGIRVEENRLGARSKTRVGDQSYERQQGDERTLFKPKKSGKFVSINTTPQRSELLTKKLFMRRSASEGKGINPREHGLRAPSTGRTAVERKLRVAQLNVAVDEFMAQLAGGNVVAADKLWCDMEVARKTLMDYVRYTQISRIYLSISCFLVFSGVVHVRCFRRC